MKKKILDEIKTKIEYYETNMGTWIDEAGGYSDLYTIKKPTRKRNTYSNPRLPEMHRAVEALATTTYRMLTASDPFFTINPVDLDIGDEHLYIVQKAIENQLKYSRYKQNLLKGLRSLVLYGNLFMEEDFMEVDINSFGRKMPITTFKPRSISQIGFDLSSVDIQNSDFIYTNDIAPRSKVFSLYESENKKGKKYWNMSALKELEKDNSEATNQFIQDRLSQNDYNIYDSKNACEIVKYYGKIEASNDNIEYIAIVVNREHLVKLMPNPDQSGNRKFRIAHWIDWELEPLGYGIGRLLKPQHRMLDANRQRMTDLLAFGSYNLWLMSTMSGINPNDLVIAPNKIIPADEMDGLKPLKTNMEAALPALKLEEVIKADFRAASGATDTLQAAVTEATASEVAIVQNEAMRRISVYAENIAEPLCREHIEKIHNNNRMFVKKDFMVSDKSQKKGLRVYPKDLNIDIDIDVKIITDKDFRPKRNEQLLRVLELITSIRTQGLDKFRIDPIPIYKELLRGLDVNPDSLIRSIEEAEILLKSAAQLSGNPNIQNNMAEGESMGIVQTPIGKVAGSQNLPIQGGG